MKKLIILLICISPNLLFSQWITSTSGTTADLRTVFFISTSTGFAGGDNGLILKTTNSGQSWGNLTTGVTENINSIFFLNASTGIASGNAGTIIRTSNSGSNWSSVSSGVTDDLRAVSFFNERGICTGVSGTILYTTNSGSNWSIAKNGFFTTFSGANMASENFAYVCGVNSIFQPFLGKSTNGGANWDYSAFYLNQNEGGLTDLNFISETEGFASAYVFDGQGAISYTSNAGDNWSTQLFPSQLFGIDMAGQNYGYAAGDNALILRTTNRGLTWVAQSNPASVLLRSIDFVDSLNGFAVGNNGTILKTTNGGLSSVQSSFESVPESFVLYQNWPNPFNPVTNFKYELRSPANVVIKVFSSSGNELATLLSERQNAGSHTIKFDGTDYPSGVYYLRMQSNGDYAARKFMLVK